ncbi:sulfite exporter TauE/SafE family protein [Halomonas llamarensis]|uniref:Probable membrane transporter protein n=1 Tax=Halomonas llamarensis TaxID=2945104 RepID=A0ABT0SVP0_9GAMM|nr:sulfite exporter TauE/SafE family protein [Halomonas llamarensis]MCL7931716.1 sulfite exporter TauE/SafE family protein [Halomonas llamarensis]
MIMEYILVALIGLAAFYIKGVTGTGTTTVIVALGSFVIDPKLTIVLSAFVNIFGGLQMIRVDPVKMSVKYWGRIAAFMVVGSVIGAFALKYTPSREFQIILGLVLLAAAIMFFVQKKVAVDSDSSPDKADHGDMMAATVSGMFSGYVGISAPPLVYYFGRYLNKRYLRRLLVIVYIPAVTAQTFTFIYNGMFTLDVLIWGLLMLPSMFFGVYMGNLTFNLISESLFRKALGLLLIVASLRLLALGILQ